MTAVSCWWRVVRSLCWTSTEPPGIRTDAVRCFRPFPQDEATAAAMTREGDRGSVRRADRCGRAPGALHRHLRDGAVRRCSSASAIPGPPISFTGSMDMSTHFGCFPIAIPHWYGCRAPKTWPSYRFQAHASEPSGPWTAGKWPVLTQIVQPNSLQGPAGPAGPGPSNPGLVKGIQSSQNDIYASAGIDFPVWTSVSSSCTATCNAIPPNNQFYGAMICNLYGHRCDYQVRLVDQATGAQLGNSIVAWTVTHPPSALILDEEQAAWYALHPRVEQVSTLEKAGRYEGTKTLEELQAESHAEAQAQLEFIKNFKRIKPHRTVAEVEAEQLAQGM